MERRKQATLGAFGFTKKVCHRGEEKTIAIPSTPTEEPRLSCVKCRSTFKNQQGLTVHMKCKHPGVSEDDVDFIEESTTVVQSALSMFQQPTKDTSIEITEKAQPPAIQPLAKPQPGPSRRRGLETRHQYSAAFKAKVISDAEGGKSHSELASKYNVNRSMIHKWIQNKNKIMTAAETEHKSHLKIRPAKKYKEMYKELRKLFLQARSKGHRVDFNWLWSKARVLQRQLTKNEKAEIRKHVIVNFIKRNNIRMRLRQRNKKQSKDKYRSALESWHAKTRERLVRRGKEENYDEKWGRFTPEERFNVDQSPCPFAVNVKKTYEMIELGNPENRYRKVWISQPGSGLDKRQCTLQVCFRPTGKQPRLAVIFRGTGKRITEAEKAASDPDVDVYFQENAWADTAFSVDWVNRMI